MGYSDTCPQSAVSDKAVLGVVQESSIEGRFSMDQPKYRLWLKLRIWKLLHSEVTSLKATVAGRLVMIESEDREQPLSEASWLVIGCRGFETEDLARDFGERLRRAVHLAGLCTGVGVDAGDPGENRTMSRFNPEAILPHFRPTNPDVRLGPDVHGIVILPDDENTLFCRGRVDVQARSNPDSFIQALEEALPDSDAPLSGSPPIRRAIRLLNLAWMSEDPIAKAVLAISTVEGLAVDKSWTGEQEELIEAAASWVQEARGDCDGVSEVVEAIRLVRNESIRQRIRKLLTANDLSSQWQAWDDLYKKRSNLVHGRSTQGDEAQGDHLERTGLHEFGQEAATLCTRIVLSIAGREGVIVPDDARRRFGIEVT